MKKRIVALFLCVVMVFSLLGVSAFADGTFTMKGSSHTLELKAGSTVDFTVEVTENPGMMAGGATIAWDKTAFELTNVVLMMRRTSPITLPKEWTV